MDPKKTNMRARTGLNKKKISAGAKKSKGDNTTGATIDVHRGGGNDSTRIQEEINEKKEEFQR